MTIPQPAGPIIVFDAQCVLCLANAQLVLRHDHRMRFRLASMQSEVGAALYRKFGIDPANPDTMIVVEGDRLARDSDAILSVYAGLGWPWKMLSMLSLIPRVLRDPVYRWVGRNRYRIFGRHRTCWVPSPADAWRIL